MFGCNNDRLFPEKYIVKDHISNTKLEKRDHYYIQTYRSRNLRKWKDFNRKQLTLHKMCVAFVILLQDVVFFYLRQVDIKGGRRLSPTPSVSNLSPQAVSLSFNGNAEFKPRFCRWLQTGKVAEIGDLWFALGAKASWSNVTNEKQNYRVLPRRNLEATGAAGAKLGPFSFSGSVGPLCWSPQTW